ncbi:MAG: hypothetical protein ACNA8W_07685, partial [Bradymonadaceae bacterium]
FASGYFHQEEMLRVALGRSENVLSAQIWDSLGTPPLDSTETCKDELSSLVSHAPRTVVGYTEFTRDRLAVKVGLEVKNDMARRLSATRTPIPGYDLEVLKNSFAMLGIGVDLSKLAEFAREVAVEIQSAPFQCDELAGLNDLALQLQFAPDQIPPFLSQVQGLSVLVSDMESVEGQPMTVDGVAVLQTGEPATLFGVMQMLIPALQGLVVEENGVPAALPAGLVLPMVDVPHVAMSSTALGFSTGVGMQDTLATLLEQPLPESTPMVVIGYNYGTIMSRVMDTFGPMMSVEDVLGPISSMFGNVVMTIDADDRGIFLHYDAELRQ